jgi:AcrR family transcriptional regulator
MTQRIPARSIRTWVDSRLGPAVLSESEIERENLILTEMRAILLRGGRPGLTMTDLALGLRLSRSTIRTAFCDLDNIVFEIIRRHLMAIEEAVLAIPLGTPDLYAARRAAYLKLASDGAGGVSDSHAILVRDRHALPPDLAEQVTALRQRLGGLLAESRPGIVLDLLDSAGIAAEEVEGMVAGLSRDGAVPAARAGMNGAAAKPGQVPAAARPDAPGTGVLTGVLTGAPAGHSVFHTSPPPRPPLPGPRAHQTTFRASLLGSSTGPPYSQD